MTRSPDPLPGSPQQHKDQSKSTSPALLLQTPSGPSLRSPPSAAFMQRAADAPIPARLPHTSHMASAPPHLPACPTLLSCQPLKPLYPPGVYEGSFSNQVPGVQGLKAYCPGERSCTATAGQVPGTGRSLQGTQHPLCGPSAEGRGASPELPPHCHSLAHSGQMAGYNGETGRSLNENIYCELQNKTQTPTGPNRREDSPGFRFQYGGSGRLASGMLMVNVGGHGPGGFPPTPPMHILYKCIRSREIP